MGAFFAVAARGFFSGFGTLIGLYAGAKAIDGAKGRPKTPAQKRAKAKAAKAKAKAKTAKRRAKAKKRR